MIWMMVALLQLLWKKNMILQFIRNYSATSGCTISSYILRYNFIGKKDAWKSNTKKWLTSATKCIWRWNNEMKGWWTWYRKKWYIHISLYIYCLMMYYRMFLSLKMVEKTKKITPATRTFLYIMVMMVSFSNSDFFPN